MQKSVSDLASPKLVFGSEIEGQIWMNEMSPVSYTHLDVYKRQLHGIEKISAALEQHFPLTGANKNEVSDKPVIL